MKGPGTRRPACTGHLTRGCQELTMTGRVAPSSSVQTYKATRASCAIGTCAWPFRVYRWGRSAWPCGRCYPERDQRAAPPFHPTACERRREQVPQIQRREGRPRDKRGPWPKTISSLSSFRAAALTLRRNCDTSLSRPAAPRTGRPGSPRASARGGRPCRIPSASSSTSMRRTAGSKPSWPGSAGGRTRCRTTRPCRNSTGGKGRSHSGGKSPIRISSTFLPLK